MNGVILFKPLLYWITSGTLNDGIESNVLELDRQTKKLNYIKY